MSRGRDDECEQQRRKSSGRKPCKEWRGHNASYEAAGLLTIRRFRCGRGYLINPIGAEKLRVGTEGIATGELALHDGESFLGRADAAVTPDFDELMLLKGE